MKRTIIAGAIAMIIIITSCDSNSINQRTSWKIKDNNYCITTHITYRPSFGTASSQKKMYSSTKCVELDKLAGAKEIEYNRAKHIKKKLDKAL